MVVWMMNEQEFHQDQVSMIFYLYILDFIVEEHHDEVPLLDLKMEVHVEMEALLPQQ